MPNFEAFDLNDETSDEHETKTIRIIKSTTLFVYVYCFMNRSSDGERGFQSQRPIR